MNDCIPDELFNMIPRPPSGGAVVSLDEFMSESSYKVPSVGDVVQKKELWHTVCDIAERLGAMIEVQESEPDADEIRVSPRFGRFLRLIGADVGLDGISSVAEDAVAFASAGDHYIMYSVVPDMTGNSPDVSGVWNPVMPAWFAKRYAKLIYDGMMMRLYAIKGDHSDAKMHANSYANGMVSSSYGLITKGMRRNIRVDVETYLVQSSASQVVGGRPDRE